MKKALLPLLAAAAMMIGFTSCQHQSMRTIEIPISANQWTVDGSLLTFTYMWPELDADVVDLGTVQAYFIMQSGSQNILPFVYAHEYLDDQGQTYFATENVSFYYGYGYITFTIEDMDGNLPANINDWGNRMVFRVVAIGD